MTFYQHIQCIGRYECVGERNGLTRGIPTQPHDCQGSGDVAAEEHDAERSISRAVVLDGHNHDKSNHADGEAADDVVASFFPAGSQL